MTLLRKSLFITTACLALPGMAAAQSVLQINSSLPEGSFAHVFLQEYETRLEAATDGAIDVQIFMSNTLGSEEDVLQGLGLGTHQASLSASAIAQINTRTAIFDLPNLFEGGGWDRDAVQAFAGQPGGRRCWPKASGAPAWCWPRCGTTASARSPTVCGPSWRARRSGRAQDPHAHQPPARSRCSTPPPELGANAPPLRSASARSIPGWDQGVIDGQENPAEIRRKRALLRGAAIHVAGSNHVYLPTFLVFGEPFLASLDPETAGGGDDRRGRSRTLDLRVG